MQDSIADFLREGDEEMQRALSGQGISPARQARSKATLRALIQTGLEAAEQRDFSEITVDAIASSANASVGAFYERFDSKEAFFTALQEIVATRIERDVRARIAAPDFRCLDTPSAVAAIMRTWLTGVRLHRGLIRASLRYIPVREGAWFPLKRLGQRMGLMYAQALGPRIPKVNRKRLERAIRVALQFVHGVVVNTILNNPGPLGLDDPELESHMNSVVCRLLELYACERKSVRRR